MHGGASTFKFHWGGRTTQLRNGNGLEQLAVCAFAGLVKGSKLGAFFGNELRSVESLLDRGDPGLRDPDETELAVRFAAASRRRRSWASPRSGDPMVDDPAALADAVAICHQWLTDNRLWDDVDLVAFLAARDLTLDSRSRAHSLVDKRFIVLVMHKKMSNSPGPPGRGPSPEDLERRLRSDLRDRVRRLSPEQHAILHCAEIADSHFWCSLASGLAQVLSVPDDMIQFAAEQVAALVVDLVMPADENSTLNKAANYLGALALAQVIGDVKI
jgi:hypothetical protein